MMISVTKVRKVGVLFGLVSWVVSTTTVAAFVISDLVTTVVPKSFSGHTRPIADLDKIVQNQLINSVLDIRLDIHNHNTFVDTASDTAGNAKKSHPLFHKTEPVVGMSINGLVLQLSGLSPPSSAEATVDQNANSKNMKVRLPSIHMPGAHSPFPAISSGVHALDVIEPGKFVDMTGTIKLPFDDDPCWEVIWKENSIFGHLVCAVQMKKTVHRMSNKAASLPASVPIYVSFPLWKRHDLTDYQERKAQVMEKAAQYLKERDDELNKMQMTPNLFQKAVHYRNAAAAVERYSLYPVHSMSKNVPDSQNVIPLDASGDILLTKVGTIWTNNLPQATTGSSISASLLDMAFTGPVIKKQNSLGTAFIRTHTLARPPALAETLTSNEPNEVNESVMS